jgi:dipeptidyl aminopeptidase/acylaminoacyl peptidase
VAVAVTRPDLDADSYRSVIHVLGTGAGDPAGPGSAPFTTGPSDSRPRWSPDGRWIAFLRVAEPGGKGPDGKPQLWVVPAAGGEPRKLCEHPLGAAGPVWSPDSTRLAYTARVPEEGRYGTDPDVTPDKEPPRRVTTNRYRIDGVGWTLDRRPHVFVVTVADGRGGLVGDVEPVQVTTGDFDDGDPAWSPDGRSLAFVSARHDSRDTDIASDVFVVGAEADSNKAAAGADVRAVTKSADSVMRPAFSPDGATIYFVAPGGLEIVGHTNGLFRVPADGSAEPERLTDAETWDLDNHTGLDLSLRPGPDSVLSIALERGGIALLRFPLDGGEPERLLGGAAERSQVQTLDQAGDVVAAVVTTGTSAGEVVVRDAGGAVRTITDFGRELARGTNLRPLIEVATTAPDGHPVHGWIVKPEGPGPFPVLLNIHGGPYAQYGYILFDEAQVYAGAGYAVVMGNPRGAAGYGDAHGRAIIGDMGNLDHVDLLALLDAALADPDLDETRVGVMGGSYGGYMTTWMAAHSGKRFKAAISERAVNAWDSMTGSSDIGWFFTEAYCGEDPEGQLRQSPLHYADRIDLPMLIIHSEQDWRCPLEQAQRLYVALKRRGVETEMLVFPGEGHELSRSGLPSHRIARFEAILDWWGRYLT